MVLSGSKFFLSFITTYAELAGREINPVWLYYRKQQRMTAAGSRLKDSDRTPMIITFLDLLAWHLGYIQLYERQLGSVRNWNRDCIWVRPNAPDISEVTIEAENDSDGPRGVLGSEAPKLMADSAHLKVLVTYPPEGMEAAKRSIVGLRTIDRNCSPL